MAQTTDFTAVMKDMMGAFPVDTSAMQDAFKTQATLGEKLSNVALDAADKSTDVSTKWTKDALAKYDQAAQMGLQDVDFLGAGETYYDPSDSLASAAIEIRPPSSTLMASTNP